MPVLVDGAQSVAHGPVNVRDLGCGFFVFSGHKLFGPTGVGVLYGRETLLEAMPPWQGGGDMIRSVSFQKTTYNSLPNKFEAGTPNIAGVVGLGAAIDYLEDLDWDALAAYECTLLQHATERLRQIPGVRILGQAAHKTAVLSFVVEEPPISTLDIGVRLDLEGVAVRTGHHCCQPLMERLRRTGNRARLAGHVQHDGRGGSLRRRVARDRGRSGRQDEAGRRLPGRRAEYPPAAADSPRAAAEELAEAFEFLDDWPQRYQYLVEMGENLPPLPDAFRTEANRVHGCQATVYLTTRKRPGTADGIEFLANADADIVNGLIAVLERLFCGQRAADVLAFDVKGFLTRIGLDHHLTERRQIGFAAMVERLRKFAATLASGEAK